MYVYTHHTTQNTPHVHFDYIVEKRINVAGNIRNQDILSWTVRYMQKWKGLKLRNLKGKHVEKSNTPPTATSGYPSMWPYFPLNCLAVFSVILSARTLFPTFGVSDVIFPIQRNKIYKEWAPPRDTQGESAKSLLIWAFLENQRCVHPCLTSQAMIV